MRAEHTVVLCLKGGQLSQTNQSAWDCDFEVTQQGRRLGPKEEAIFWRTVESYVSHFSHPSSFRSVNPTTARRLEGLIRLGLLHRENAPRFEWRAVPAFVDNADGLWEQVKQFFQDYGFSVGEATAAGVEKAVLPGGLAFKDLYEGAAYLSPKQLARIQQGSRWSERANAVGNRLGQVGTVISVVKEAKETGSPLRAVAINALLYRLSEPFSRQLAEPVVTWVFEESALVPLLQCIPWLSTVSPVGRFAQGLLIVGSTCISLEYVGSWIKDWAYGGSNLVPVESLVLEDRLLDIPHIHLHIKTQQAETPSLHIPASSNSMLLRNKYYSEVQREPARFNMRPIIVLDRDNNPLFLLSATYHAKQADYAGFVGIKVGTGHHQYQVQGSTSFSLNEQRRLALSAGIAGSSCQDIQLNLGADLHQHSETLHAKTTLSTQLGWSAAAGAVVGLGATATFSETAVGASLLLGGTGKVAATLTLSSTNPVFFTITAATLASVTLYTLGHKMKRKWATKQLPFLDPNSPDSIKLARMLRDNKGKVLSESRRKQLIDQINYSLERETDPFVQTILKSMHYRIKNNTKKQCPKDWYNHGGSLKAFQNDLNAYQKDFEKAHKKIVKLFNRLEFDVARKACHDAMEQFPHDKKTLRNFYPLLSDPDVLAQTAVEFLQKTNHTTESMVRVETVLQQEANRGISSEYSKSVQAVLKFNLGEREAAQALATPIIQNLTGQQDLSETARCALDYALGVEARILASKPITAFNVAEINRVLSEMSDSSRRQCAYDVLNEIEKQKSEIHTKIDQLQQNREQNHAYQASLLSLSKKLSEINQCEFEIADRQYHTEIPDQKLLVKYLKAAASIGHFGEVRSTIEQELPSLLSQPSSQHGAEQAHCMKEVKGFAYYLGLYGHIEDRTFAISALEKFYLYEATASERNKHELAVTHFYLGRLKEQNTLLDYRAVCAHYQAAAELDPSNQKVAIAYAKVLCKQMEYAQAHRVLEACATHHSDPETLKSFEARHSQVERQKLEFIAFYSSLACRGLSNLAHKLAEKSHGHELPELELAATITSDVLSVGGNVFSNSPKLLQAESRLSQGFASANILIGMAQLVSYRIKDFSKEHPKITLTVDWLATLNDSAQSASSFYNSWISACNGLVWSPELNSYVPKQSSPLGEVMDQVNFVAIVPGFLHRQFFEPWRQQGATPTSFSGIVTEDLSWLAGNKFTTMLLSAYSNREFIQNGAVFMVNYAPSEVVQLLDYANQGSIQILSVVDVNALMTQVSNLSLGATAASAKAAFVALSTTGKVLVITGGTGAVILGVYGAHRYYNYRWYNNQLYNAETHLDLVRSDYKEAKYHVQTARKSALELVKYHPNDTAAQQTLKNTTSVQKVLTDTESRLAAKHGTSLSPHLVSLPNDLHAICANPIHVMIEGEMKKVYEGIKKLQEDKSIPLIDKSVALFSYLERISDLYQQQYQLLTQQIQRSQNNKHLRKSKIQLNKEVVKLELDLALQDKQNLITHIDIANRHMSDLQQLDSQDSDLISLDSRLAILKEIRKPITEQDNAVILQQLKKVGPKDRLDYGFAVHASFAEKRKFISDKLKNILEKKEELTKECLEQKALTLWNELDLLDRKLYVIAVQESSEHPTVDLFFITELRLGAKFNDRTMVLSVIQKKLERANISLPSQELVDAMKDSVYQLGLQGNTSHRKELDQQLRAIANYDQHPNQKGKTACYLGHLCELDVYLDRSEVFEHFKHAFELEPGDLDAAISYAQEFCLQMRYFKARDILNESILALRQQEPKSEQTTKNIARLEAFDRMVVDRQISTMLFYGNILLWLVTQGTQRAARLANLNDSQQQFMENSLKILAVGGVFGNFVVQLVQHVRLPQDPSSSSLQISRAQLAFSGLSILMQGVGNIACSYITEPEAQRNFYFKLECGHFVVNSLQMATSTMSAAYRFHHSFSSMMSQRQALAPTQWVQLGVDSACLLSIPASFCQKQWFDKRRQEGKAPISLPEIMAEDVAWLCSHRAITTMLYVYSNATVIRDGMGFVLSKCPQATLKTIESLVAASSVAATSSHSNGAAFIESAKALWGDLDQRSKAVAALSGLALSTVLFYQYWKMRWYYNLLANAQTKLKFSTQDLQNSIVHMEAAISDLDQILRYYPDDSTAKILRNTIDAIKQAEADEVKFEENIKNLTKAAQVDPENAVVINLAKIQAIVKAAFSENITDFHQSALARQGLEAINQLEPQFSSSSLPKAIMIRVLALRVDFQACVEQFEEALQTLQILEQFKETLAPSFQEHLTKKKDEITRILSEQQEKKAEEQVISNLTEADPIAVTRASASSSIGANPSSFFAPSTSTAAQAQRVDIPNYEIVVSYKETLNILPTLPPLTLIPIPISSPIASSSTSASSFWKRVDSLQSGDLMSQSFDLASTSPLSTPRSPSPIE